MEGVGCSLIVVAHRRERLGTDPQSSEDWARVDADLEDEYVRSFGDVFAYLLALVRDRAEADDLASETFERALRAWRAAGSIPPRPLPWLLLTARRLATDRWRRAKRALALRPLVSSVELPPEPYFEALAWLDTLAHVLPSRQREALVLRYQGDLTDAEIGLVMGLSESGVRSLVARGIATLRNHPEVWE